MWDIFLFIKDVCGPSVEFTTKDGENATFLEKSDT